MITINIPPEARPRIEATSVSHGAVTVVIEEGARVIIINGIEGREERVDPVTFCPVVEIALAGEATNLAIAPNIFVPAVEQIIANNAPVIPDELSDLAGDSTHRTVTDTEKSTWGGKADPDDIPAMATSEETIAGTITDKTTNPAGVKAATDLITARIEMMLSGKAFQSIYTEFVSTGGDITQINYWTNSGKTTKLFTKDITYTSGNPTTIVMTDNETGKVLTTTIAWNAGEVTSITKIWS